ncbi:MAG TPA: class I SAM-dependent rRNA methyltransferase, partial [Flavobacteriales bacterium]|nr:class I SAM-dependent rRNA methyltransferase [Flavobacteriales bacterium]
DPEERPTTAYRLLFGENDGFPGLIADVYDNVAVLKLYSAIWFPWLELIVPQVVAVAEVDAVVLRLSRHLQQEHTPRKEGDILHGELLDPEVRFQEYGVRFQANVLLGHKTGFFLDHRANRHRIGQLAKGKAVLDVFSYAGGFSVHALAGGATEVTSVDVSRQALELAGRNAALNPHEGKHITLAGDAFGILADLVAQGKRYDIVVIDPPSFAKSEKEMAGALRKYAELALLGVRLTKPGGLVVLASCSSRITADEFLQVHRTAFGQAGVKYRMEDFTGHDIDHPVRFPEGAYLKTAYYRMVG